MKQSTVSCSGQHKSFRIGSHDVTIRDLINALDKSLWQRNRLGDDSSNMKQCHGASNDMLYC